MLSDVLTPTSRRSKAARPIWLHGPEAVKDETVLGEASARWARETGFKAGAGEVLLMPGDEPGAIAGAADLSVRLTAV